MMGLSVLGSAVGPLADGTAMAFIMMGKYDLELSCALYYKAHGYPDATLTQEQLLADVETKQALENIKDWIRKGIQNIFDTASKHMELQIKEDLANLVAQQKAAQLPSVYGTVAEIAAKYKISKSEVRRLKADGKLEEFVASQSN